MGWDNWEGKRDICWVVEKTYAPSTSFVVHFGNLFSLSLLLIFNLKPDLDCWQNYNLYTDTFPPLPSRSNLNSSRSPISSSCWSQLMHSGSYWRKGDLTLSLALRERARLAGERGSEGLQVGNTLVLSPSRLVITFISGGKRDFICVCVCVWALNDISRHLTKA